MGNIEEEKAPKPEKSSAAAMDNNNIHMYPDWATMQAYYGTQFAVPPYVNSMVAAPHAPYMWGPPQSMIPPYGHPYAAFYAQGGVYAHPGISMVGTTLNMETPMRSSENAGGGFVEKSKEFNGLAIAISNGNLDSSKHGSECKLSESKEIEDSSNGSNGVSSGALKSSKKRSRQESSSSDIQAQKKGCSFPAAEVGQSTEKLTNITSANVPVKSNALVLKDPSDIDVKSGSTNVAQPSVSSEAWLQNEGYLRRERRKLSNRESARRSRLRKQAEAEELAAKVQALTAENIALKSEQNKLIESSEKLRLKNAALLEKLRNAQLGQKQEANLHMIDNLMLNPIGTVNLLARVNNSDSTDKRNEDEELYEKRTKLHQLLDAGSRTDPVAAS